MKRGRKPIPIIERIRAMTVIDKITGCWLYFGRKDRFGYGYVKDAKRRNRRVHRLSASEFLGLDLDDKKLNANHKDCCPNKNCWNPEHLYVGTQQHNTNDYKTKRKLTAH